MIKRLKSLLLENKTVRQTVLKNTVWLFTGEFTARFIRAGIIIYAARLLGAAEYGVFSYAMSLAAFVTIFSDLGIGSILTREVAKDPEARLRYFSTTFIIKVGLILFNLGVILYIAPLFTRVEAVVALLPLVATLFIFDSFREFGFAMFRALEKMEVEAFIKVATNIGVAVLGFTFIHSMATANSLATGYVLGTSIGFLITMWMFRSYFRDLFTHFDRKLVFTIFNYAWPIGLAVILGSVMINTDMVMLGWWRAPAELGYYAAAQKPIQLLYVIPGLLASAFLPTFSRLANIDNERMKILLKKSVSSVLMLAFPIVVGGSLLAPQFIQLLYGAEYLPATGAFQVLLLTLAVAFPGTILSSAIFSYNKQKKLIPIFLLGAVGNIVLNSFLIPPFGIVGAAVATLLSQSLSNFFVWQVIRKLNHFTVLSQLKKVIVATIGMALATFVMSSFGTNVVVNILVSAGVYGAILYAIKETLLHEVKAIVRGG